MVRVHRAALAVAAVIGLLVAAPIARAQQPTPGSPNSPPGTGLQGRMEFRGAQPGQPMPVEIQGQPVQVVHAQVGAPALGAPGGSPAVRPAGTPLGGSRLDRVDDVASGASFVDATQVAPAHGGKGQALFFWLFALAVIGGAIATVTRSNAVSAVMCLVGTFIALAAIYTMLFAHFLAVIQVLVYAGAIMVLFVFVVMILNKEEEEPWALRGLVGKILAGASLGYLLFRLCDVLWRFHDRVTEARWQGEQFHFYGSTRAVGYQLFGSYLFPFEAISLLLLIAVIGALVLAHPGHPASPEYEGDTPDKETH